MAIDYRITARELVRELGGDSNITNVAHCATRLRFILKDASVVDSAKVAKIPGVITTVQAGGQYQVVIGNHVKDAFGFVMELVTVDEDAAGTSKNKVGILNRIVDIISSIFAPFLYTLAACGILQGILGIFVALNAIDTSGGTYQILNFISWTAFTFLPVLISITAAKKFGVNTYAAVVIACALVCPDYINMVNTGADVYFLGMKVQLLSYTSSVIPIILSIWVASYVQKFFDKYLPIVVRNLFSPMFTIAIMVPLTLLAFGPIGNAVGGAIGGVYNSLYGLSPIAAGIIVGGLWEVLVIFGVHWGIAGAFHAVSWGYNMPGIATIPAYFKAGYGSEFIGFLISIVVSFVLGVVLAYIAGFEENVVEAQEAIPETAEKAAGSVSSKNGVVLDIASPAKGLVVPIEEVRDEVFASKGMGDGIGIVAEEGKVHAPFDASVEALFPTGHAIGLSANGVELLVHIGINTVELDGRGFQAHVAQGDTVRRGDLLVTFDKEMIEKEGYDTTVICVVTEMGDGAQLDVRSGCKVNMLETVMSVR